MQMLCKCYAKFTLSTCSGPAATAHEFLQPSPTALRSVVVVGTTDSSVSLGPVTAITRPVLLVPVRRSGLSVYMEPLHKLSLQHDGQSQTPAASNSHQYLVELPYLT